MSIIAPKTITAVDPVGNTLTIPAHGLTTGDPFVGIYSPDGGTPPAPILTTDDLWVIRIDNDTIQLATSSSNAISLVAIDLTTAGSGTLQLVQGLPYRRPTIAAPLTPAKSAHINQTWESIQAVWSFLTGQPQSVFKPVVTGIPAAAAHTGAAAHSFSTAGNSWRLGNAAGVGVGALVYPIVVEDGRTITSISIKASKQSDATNTLTMWLGESDGISLFSEIAAFTATNSADAPGTVTLMGNGSKVVKPGWQYAIVVFQTDSTPSAVDSFGRAEFTHI